MKSIETPSFSRDLKNKISEYCSNELFISLRESNNERTLIPPPELIVSILMKIAFSFNGSINSSTTP